MVVPVAQEVHTGVIEAEVMRGKGIIAFLNDGSRPFETEGCEAAHRRVLPNCDSVR